MMNDKEHAEAEAKFFNELIVFLKACDMLPESAPCYFDFSMYVEKLKSGKCIVHSKGFHRRSAPRFVDIPEHELAVEPVIFD